MPTARLVVLGEPGAGKTILMVRLVLDLLARRLPGRPVPLLLPVALWDPTKQDLREWIVAQLSGASDRTIIGRPTGFLTHDQASALARAKLILPILDGLDEIDDLARSPAIARINECMVPGESVILTCRTEGYRHAVRPPEGIGIALRGAAAIQLRPLSAEVVASYLVRRRLAVQRCRLGGAQLLTFLAPRPLYLGC